MGKRGLLGSGGWQWWEDLLAAFSPHFGSGKTSVIFLYVLFVLFFLFYLFYVLIYFISLIFSCLSSFHARFGSSDPSWKPLHKEKKNQRVIYNGNNP